MNALDIIILILVLVPAAFGLSKGLIKSIFSYISIIAGIIVALKFNSGFVLVIKPLIKDPKLIQLIIFATVILTFYFLGIFIASKISKLSFISEMLDKAGGFIFGALKGTLFASILLIIFDSFSMLPAKQKEGSYTYTYAIQAAPATYNLVKDFLPLTKKDFYDIIKPGGNDSLKIKSK